MLEGKRIAILIEESFEETELTELIRAMRDNWARVVLLGAGPEDRHVSKRGTVTLRVDAKADQVKAADFDAIIIPGWSCPTGLVRCQPLIVLIKDANTNLKIIAALGYGPQLMLASSIVVGRRLTSAPAIADELKSAGAEWIDAPVVKDKNLITARKLVDLPRFCKAIIETVHTAH